MTAPALTFYFDFSSPYGYLAAQKIDELATAHGTTAAWRPHLLGAMFKLTGNTPLLDQPIKGDYARHDLVRAARRIGVPFGLPDPFPFAAIAASRAFYWFDDRDHDTAKAFARRAFHASFGEQRDLSKPAAVVETMVASGADKQEAEAALADPAIKQRLRYEVDDAIARGIFGSPMILVGDEPFWGYDRLPDIAAWLDQGGW